METVYDVRECCLEYLRSEELRAQELTRKAAADTVEACNNIQGLETRRGKLNVDIRRLNEELERFRGARKVSDAVKRKRERFRELRRELRELDAEVRLETRRRDADERDRKVYESISCQIGGVYTHVEQCWIPGCLVQRKPVFNNLIPKF